MIEDINLLNSYLKSKYGKKVYKISLNGGMSCPNRDGKIGYGGCIFCSRGGSGDFASSSELSICEQVAVAKELIKDKLPKEECGFIAYFQAYTNTYGPIEYLEKIYREAIEDDEVVALSIATRPDCLDDEVLNLLKRINDIKPVMVELGLQTANDEVAEYIRRGYKTEVFEKALNSLAKIGIEVIVHLIIGLPGEDKKQFLDSIDYINKLPVSGVKLQLLHILKDTDLADLYNEGKVKVLTMEEYTDILMSSVKRLRKDIVIHRMTGDGPKKYLIAPIWSGDKKMVLNTINRYIRENDIIQGVENEC